MIHFVTYQSCVVILSQSLYRQCNDFGVKVMRALTILGISIFLAFEALPAFPDDKGLIEDMELEITIQRISKDAMQLAQERSIQALEKTTIYKEYLKERDRLYRSLLLHNSIAATLRRNFSPKKKDELRLGTLMSSGYSEVESVQFVFMYRCDFAYEYSDPKRESCSDKETDIQVTMASYSLCIIHYSALEKEREKCEKTEMAIRNKYPDLKKYVDDELETMTEERQAWQDYKHFSLKVDEIYKDIKPILDKFTWQLYQQEMKERLEKLKIKITKDILKTIEKEYNRSLVEA